MAVRYTVDADGTLFRVKDPQLRPLDSLRSLTSPHCAFSSPRDVRSTPIADKRGCSRIVRFVPIADIAPSDPDEVQHCHIVHNGGFRGLCCSTVSLSGSGHAPIAQTENKNAESEIVRPPRIAAVIGIVGSKWVGGQLLIAGDAHPSVSLLAFQVSHARRAQ
jgi:hypothetical protein